MATPPSIERPKYRGYHFQRARVRASRQATLPVILTDRWRQQSWQTPLRRRESREVFVVDGLDRQDEDYARHSQDSLTEDGLQQWLAEPPALALADMVAGLIDRPQAVPTDRLAFQIDDTSTSDQGPISGGQGSIVGDQALDAAALPPPGLFYAGKPATASTKKPSAENGVSRSRITIIGEKRRAQGVYVAPHFILTPSDVIGGRGLVDIEDRPDHRALGLVAAVDPGLGLALIHAPVPGRPVVVGNAGQALTPSAPVNSDSFQIFDKDKTISSRDGAESGPVVVNNRLIGFRTERGPAIESDAIRAFLDRQQHLLPIGP